MWQRQKKDQWLPSPVSLTLPSPSANTFPIPSSPDKRSRPHLSLLALTEWTETANLGSGTVQWGSHLGSATRPILAENATGGETQLGSEAKRGRKEEDTVAQTLRKMEDVLAQKAGKEERRVTSVTWSELCHPKWITNHLGKHNAWYLVECNGIHSCEINSTDLFPFADARDVTFRNTFSFRLLNIWTEREKCWH